MKRSAFVFAVTILCLVVPGLLLAQANPAVGTWKLNVEKSKYPAGMAPKSLTRTVSADGESVKYSFEGEGPDGTALKYGFTVKYDGKDYEVTGNGMPFGADHIAIKRDNSHMFSATLKKDGKEIGTSVSTVSHDGKTTTLNGKGTDAKGNMVKTTSIFDKQ
jgi:hypothetical protein